MKKVVICKNTTNFEHEVAFLCETCGTVYYDKMRALACECDHSFPEKIVDCKYYSGISDPVKITVKMNSGKGDKNVEFCNSSVTQQTILEMEQKA